MLDQKLIGLAEQLVQGRGDGRISDDDVDKLWEAAHDEGKLSIVKAAVFFRLLNEFKWTKAGLLNLLIKVEPGGNDPHPEIAEFLQQFLPEEAGEKDAK